MARIEVNRDLNRVYAIFGIEVINRSYADLSDTELLDFIKTKIENTKQSIAELKNNRYIEIVN